MGNNYLKPKPIKLIDQGVRLQILFPNSRYCIKKGVLYWHGKIQPTALSDEYNVEIIYKLKKIPEIILSGDNVKKINSPDFPHHYRIDHEKMKVWLCLYYGLEFCSTDWLADSIVPWVVEWLYFYEIWLFTGTWQGGGKHPRIRR